MSERSRSPGRQGRNIPEAASSPISREVVSAQMQEIFTVVKQLRDEKVVLQKQLDMVTQHTEQEERRLIKDLHKVRTQVDHLSELFHECADGIDTKSTVAIPELPEAAVAKVVPRELRNLLSAKDNHHHAGENSSIQSEIGHAQAATKEAVKQYERLAEAGKGLVWDVERLQMIIKAYEADLMNLKDAASEVKSTLNRARLAWRKKFSSCRRWQDFTRRSQVLKFQELLDQTEDQFEYDKAFAAEELESLLGLIGSMLARNNRVKLTLFLKRMKNALIYKMWRGWNKFHIFARCEKLGIDGDLSEEEAAKIAAMMNGHRNAMLRQFMLRWQLRKIAVPFSSWKDVWYKKKAAGMETAADRERNALLAKLKILEASAVGQKLSLMYAKIAGKMKDLTFRALVKNNDMGRIARLMENEKFKRLKVFLEYKLKGIKHTTFKCLEREANDVRAHRLKNTNAAKKVGAFFEMKMKGVKYTQFNAFKRFADEAKAERAEEDRLAKLIAARDSQSLHRLRVFLQGKAARQKYGALSYWKWIITNDRTIHMERLLNEKSKKRASLTAALQELEIQAGLYLTKDAEEGLANAAANIKSLSAQAASLEKELAAALTKLKDVDDQLTAEKDGHSKDASRIASLLAESKELSIDKAALEKELALIYDQIGFLSEYSK